MEMIIFRNNSADKFTKNKLLHYNTGDTGNV